MNVPVGGVDWPDELPPQHLILFPEVTSSLPSRLAPESMRMASPKLIPPA